jgi:cystathionine beta-synthase
VPVTRLDTGPAALPQAREPEPGGSIKDRIGLSMIEAAERDGSLKPGGTIVEATAGNTGLGLALVAARKGYKLVLVIPDKMSREKVFHLKAMGAEVVMTRSDVGKGHPDYYQDKAERIAKETGAFYVNQFGNPANPFAHETTTGPEIWKQMDGKVDAVVCGVGSSGTITASRASSARPRRTWRWCSRPRRFHPRRLCEDGAIRGSGLVAGRRHREDFVPPIADLTGVKEAYSIRMPRPSRSPVSSSRRKGSSRDRRRGPWWPRRCATAARARSRARRDVRAGQRQQVSLEDVQRLLARRPGLHRARASRGPARLHRPPVEERATVSVGPDDTLLIAYGRFKLNDVSQLPVLEGEQIVGIIDEYDVLGAVTRGESHFRDVGAQAHEPWTRDVSPGDSLDQVVAILDATTSPSSRTSDRFYGLITRIDLLNSLRRKLQ